LPTFLSPDGGIGRHRRLALLAHLGGKNQERKVAGALSEKRDVEWRKFREALTDNADGNPERSLLLENKKERAETRHATPKAKKSIIS